MSYVRSLCLAFAATSMAWVVGCSEDELPVPRVFLSTTMTPGNNPPEKCGVQAASWVNIGTSSQSVDNGGEQSGASVTVQCDVKPAGGETFDVLANATLTGQRGGSVTISGKFTPTGEQKNVNVRFNHPDFGVWSQADCTVTYTNPNMHVAAGRVWGQLSCPTMSNKSGTTERLCNGVGEFKFENCNQQ
jgi:hypothetical protein